MFQPIVEPQVQATPPAPPAATVAPPAPVVEPPKQESEADRIARLERELTAARQEAGKERVNAKASAAESATQDVLTKVLGALGIEPDGKKKVTIDDVTSDLAKRDGKILDLTAENAVLRRAAQAGADPDKLLNWSPFVQAMKALDPSDQGKYGKAVDALIAETVSANPFLKLAQAAGKSGTELSGGTGEGTKSIQERISEAEAKGDFVTSRQLKNMQLLGN